MTSWESAIGGKTIATTVEGRERYPISVRYARDFREDLDALKRVLVPVPMTEAEAAASSAMPGQSAGTGGGSKMAQIPISMLADIRLQNSPPSIRNENGQLVGFVFVDITGDDIQGYVDAASNASVNLQISTRLLHPMGGAIRVSQKRRAETQAGCAVHPVDYFRA